MANELNRNLLFGALRSMNSKSAFVPPGGDPSGGGGPPPGGDPSGGGAPLPTGGDPSGAGGPPPGDPSGGGAPPPDPSMGGGAPPPPDAGGGGVGGAPPGGDIAAQVVQGVTQALAGSGLQGNKSPTAPKPDINTIATDVFQLKKLLVHMFRHQGMELPPDILDGPNRDPQTGAPAFGQGGGSVVAPGASAQQAGGAPGGAGGSAIQPIQPMQGASPMGKTGSDNGSYCREITAPQLQSKAAATAHLLRSRRGSRN